MRSESGFEDEPDRSPINLLYSTAKTNRTASEMDDANLLLFSIPELSGP